MDNQLLHYSEIQDEPEAEQVIDVDSLYSISNSDFSAEEFLENSLSKEIGILEEQIASCREELKERERLHERQIKDLKEKAQEYRSGLTNPIEMKRLAKGDNLGEQKANLSEKIGTIEERVREEERENWKDTQELKDRITGIRKGYEDKQILRKNRTSELSQEIRRNFKFNSRDLFLPKVTSCLNPNLTHYSFVLGSNY